jgi:hypothetical protein
MEYSRSARSASRKIVRNICRGTQHGIAQIWSIRYRAIAEVRDTLNTGTGPIKYRCAQTGAPLVLSENVPALSTFTWDSFGSAHNCDFWDGVLVYQPPF